MNNEIIRVGQIGIRFLLETADTNRSLAMFEFPRCPRWLPD
jgi:hypothetical protein